VLQRRQRLRKNFRAAVITVACAVVLSHGSAAFAASEAAEVEKARAAYFARNYAEVEKKCGLVLEPGRTPDSLVAAQARMLLGASLVMQGRDTDAIPVFEALLSADGQYDPDPLMYSTHVIEVFIDTKERLRERLAELAKEEARKAAALKEQELNEKRKRDARVRLLERLASQETVVYKNSRSIAMLPFGIGQFQNRSRNWGWFFFGAEAVFLVGASAMLPAYLDAESSKSAALATDRSQAEQYRSRANVLRGFNLGFALAFFGTWMAGAIEAQASFVPEFRELRTRNLPPIGQAPGRGAVAQWAPLPTANDALSRLSAGSLATDSPGTGPLAQRTPSKNLRPKWTWELPRINLVQREDGRVQGAHLLFGGRY
jgi:hypothetical protein